MAACVRVDMSLSLITGQSTGQSIPRVSVGVMVRTEEMQTGDRAQYTQTVIGRQIDRHTIDRNERRN